MADPGQEFQYGENLKMFSRPAQHADTDISGMNPAEAKEYILGFITTLKLAVRQIKVLDGEAEKWQGRVDLARSKGMLDMAEEASKELQQIDKKRERINAEADTFRSQIEKMRRELPALAARQRTIDPDLLEQELLMTAGYLPGDEEKAQSDRKFRDMEKAAEAESALDALKVKMALSDNGDPAFRQ